MFVAGATTFAAYDSDGNNLGRVIQYHPNREIIATITDCDNQWVTTFDVETVFDYAGMRFNRGALVEWSEGRTFTAKREHGEAPNCSGDFNGRWVVRDENGHYVDHDQYRNDLKGRYPGLVVEG